MLRSRILPVLLLSDKGLVKTTSFADPKYVGDPLNAVKIFNEKEVDELAFIDIDASREQREPDFDLIGKIAIECRMPLAYGGGVRSANEAARLISLGAEKVLVSSAALQRPDLIREMADAVGTQSVCVVLDVKKKSFPFGGYQIFTLNGKQKHKGDLNDTIHHMQELGAGEIIINSIDQDGMMEGYDLDLAKQARAQTDLPLTMIGGAGSVDHLAELIDAIGTCGAGAGSMFVFNGKYRAVLISYKRP
jgi:cyclase